MNKRKLIAPLVWTAIVAAPLMLYFARYDTTPELASAQGATVDWLLRIEFTIAAFFFALCIVFLLYSLVAFRRRTSDKSDGLHIHGNTALEIGWTIIPLVIVVAIGFLGLQNVSVLSFDESVTPLEVEVHGFQWAWRFHYPAQPELGVSEGITTTALTLPVDTPVRFHVTSDDVIHSFWIPELRTKADAIPGRVNVLNLTPNVAGTYKVRCAELCGTSHAIMYADVEVTDAGAFAAWVDEEIAIANDPSLKGLKVAQQYACIGCHSPDGTVLAGPTWQGLYQSERVFDDGEVQVADDDYLLQSILKPNEHIVEGFTAGVMPVDFGERMSDEEIQQVIDYIKTLQDGEGGADADDASEDSESEDSE